MKKTTGCRTLQIVNFLNPLDKPEICNYSYTHKRSGFVRIYSVRYRAVRKALKKRSRRMSSQREVSGEVRGERRFEIRIR